MSGTLGIVMLVHTAFGRAEQVIRHWQAAGCPVVVHVDRSVPADRFDAFRSAVRDLRGVSFSRRYRCEWGTWGIVAASQAASEQMLEEWPGVRHVYLASGSCLPLRPVRELVAYLEERSETDFIESATIADVPWTIGGLDHERFTLRFPFAWKRQRWLFDQYVELQRRLGVRRRLPEGVVPHMGSQWWCLTRGTLEAILGAPQRAEWDRFFRRVWIPDESYFQSLVRLVTRKMESRSLTLSKFDFQGKPHIFYDDHLPLLRRSDCFVARKIWSRADRLYETFLDPTERALGAAEPNPGKIDRVFAKAVERRTRGRPGLYMQSRLPNENWENGLTAARYSVFEGFSDLFEGFEGWLARTVGGRVHGHLFAPDRAEFEGGQHAFVGALTDNAEIRDYNARMFLTNLIWNTRGERQSFQFGPRDTQYVSEPIARDSNAQISVVSGAWAVPLFRSSASFGELRVEAARLQKIETAHLDALRSPQAKARVRIWTMAEFLEAPREALQAVVDDIRGPARRQLAELPRMADLDGFGQFLQNLKNEGMHPYLMGDFPVEGRARAPERPRRKPYLVR